MRTFFFFFVFCSTTLELFVYLVDVQLVTEKLFVNIQYYHSDVVFFFFVCQFLKVGCVYRCLSNHTEIRLPLAV